MKEIEEKRSRIPPEYIQARLRAEGILRVHQLFFLFVSKTYNYCCLLMGIE